MDDENYAILVGIARYRSDTDYPPLDGPRQDVAHIRKWLVDPNGGNVPRKNIYVLATPRTLLKPGRGTDPAQLSWTPDQAAFIRAFQNITIDTETGEYKRRDSRIYLYFSGHGFSVAADTTDKAALFTANAFGIARPNIPGTVYAEAAKRVALFKEIVLIMDCCRDIQRNSFYAAYELDQTESGLAEKVRLFSMYATSKNGKAQEREFADKGRVYGLLTHALIRALDEAPTNVLGQVSSTNLNNYLKIRWEKWYSPTVPAPVPIPIPAPPRTVPAVAGEIFFGSRKKLVAQPFIVRSTGPSIVRLESAHLDVVGELGADGVCWSARNDPENIVIKFGDVAGERGFALKLAPCPNTLSVSGRPEATITFDPRIDHVIAL